MTRSKKNRMKARVSINDTQTLIPELFASSQTTNSIKISERDMEFLRSLGDSEMGFAIRGEVAEMCGVPVEEVDTFVLKKINGNELD